MTQPSSLPPPSPDALTADEIEFALIYHHAAPEMRAMLRRLATARVLTPAEIDLVHRYNALTPGRQALVDDLLRELGALPVPLDPAG